jgi:hypothetical protein
VNSITDILVMTLPTGILRDVKNHFAKSTKTALSIFSKVPMVTAIML